MSDQPLRPHDEQRRRRDVESPPGMVDDLTAAWHEARHAFEHSEKRYHDLVEHSLGLICTHDLTGRLLSINPAAARSLGYDREYGIGRHLADFLAPDIRHAFDGYLRRIREHGQDAGLMRVISRDGGERVWMYRNVLYQETGGPPYVLGHAIDITERIAAERALQEKEHALRRAHNELERRVKERTAALEQANALLRVEIAERERAEASRERALIEQRDTLAFLAAVSERLAPVLSAEHLLDVVRTLPVPFLADWTILHVLMKDGTWRSEPGIHLDPERLPTLARLAAATSAPLPSDALISQVIATERLTIATTDAEQLVSQFAGPGPVVELLRELGTGSLAIVPIVVHGQLTAALSLGAAADGRFATSGAMVVEEIARRIGLTVDRIRLYREAQEANRLKDEFLGTLSHELRTPLNAVIGWTQILATRQLDEKTAHAIAIIARNAQAQVRLIEDVLDVSRIITGHMTLRMESLDLRAALNVTIDTVRPAMEAKGLRLEKLLSDDVPAVFADPHRVQQVFWNVLWNAVKFTGTGGLITVTLRKAHECAEIEIADTGVGIRPDVLPYVFDRYRQGDSSTTRAHGGLGLGLAIVRHIVELHGGSVGAASAGEGQGATFTIQLPVERRSGRPAG